MNICFGSDNKLTPVVPSGPSPCQLTLVNPLPGGPIASIQRDGSLQGRPAGNAGGFETFYLSGNYAYVYPDGPSGSPAAGQPVTPGYAFVVIQ